MQSFFVLQTSFLGVVFVGKRSKMSDALKMEIARELGVYDKVKSSGDWGDVSSRECGNMVSKAIEIAERSVAGK